MNKCINDLTIVVNTIEDAREIFLGDINWEYLSGSEGWHLSESFMREFLFKLNKIKISKYQKLSEDFINDFSKELDWDFLLKYQILSKDFLIKHLDQIYPRFSWLQQNLHISKEIKEEISLILKLTQ